MKSVYLSYNSIYSNLGRSSEEVVQALFKAKSGLEPQEDPALLPVPFCAALLSDEKVKKDAEILKKAGNYTKLEKMLLLCLKEVIEASGLDLNDRVGLIISTTKGNIDLLADNRGFAKSRVYLSEMAKTIQRYFDFKSSPVILSNACVSGLLAVLNAKSFIDQGRYDHVFVVSGDIISQFVLSGFFSFQALSSEPCKPYDADRNGINLGEAAAAVLVTSSTAHLSKDAVEVVGGASCNDANHISGPSRTGEGLYRSIQSALKEAQMQPQQLDFISAHGTATAYNDAMESIAFQRLGLSKTPLHSLKGYFGHTLGAAGLLETIVGMHSLHRNTLLASKGFSTLGVPESLEVIKENREQLLTYFLKTASGFGGCNTAGLFKKVFL